MWIDSERLLEDAIEALCNKDIDIKNIIIVRRKEIINLLLRYINEIELFNKAYGLVGASSTEELIKKHIIDSLAPIGIIFRLINELHITEEVRIADAGSGAGLPGVPLAIIFPRFQFTLIERMGRRAGFLWNIKAVLSLSNITVEEGEMEKTSAGRFNLITFRAFKPLNKKLLTSLFNACKENGIIAAYKGKREKIELEIEQCINREIISYSAPFLDDERNLLVIRKNQLKK